MSPVSVGSGNCSSHSETERHPNFFGSPEIYLDLNMDKSLIGEDTECYTNLGETEFDKF